MNFKKLLATILSITMISSSWASVSRVSTDSFDKQIKKENMKLVRSVQKADGAAEKRAILNSHFSNIISKSDKILVEKQVKINGKAFHFDTEQLSAIEELAYFASEYQEALKYAHDQELNELSQSFANEFQKAGGILYVLSILIPAAIVVWFLARVKASTTVYF